MYYYEEMDALADVGKRTGIWKGNMRSLKLICAPRANAVLDITFQTGSILVRHL